MAFRINNIYKTFSSEWVKYKYDNFDKLITYENWKDFIKIKDLGIVCVSSYPSANQDEYEIIDEKKWILTKIKYGF